jgi:hypothetical protein
LVINLFLSDEAVDDDFAQLFVRMLLLIHIDMIHPTKCTPIGDIVGRVVAKPALELPTGSTPTARWIGTDQERAGLRRSELLRTLPAFFSPPPPRRRAA